MKNTIKLNWFLSLLFICTSVTPGLAQTKEDVLSRHADITFLGLDFSQTKFIGDATQYKEAGVVTNDDFRDKYSFAWNQLFIKEKKKYDVAKAIGYKEDIKYDLDIAENANNELKKNFFSNDLSDYHKLTADKIATIVKQYNFQGKKGIGMIVFVEGMSKGKEEASAWVTFVDMDTKKVLLTGYRTGSAGGIGFKNYWAKAFLNILKDSNPKDLK